MPYAPSGGQQEPEPYHFFRPFFFVDVDSGIGGSI